MSADSGGVPQEHEEHVNHEAWVIPYADLLTLLMAMFIALFAISTVDTSKFKDLSIGFNEALGGGRTTARCSRVRTRRTTRRSPATDTAPAPARAEAWSRARTSSPRPNSRSSSTPPSS